MNRMNRLMPALVLACALLSACQSSEPAKNNAQEKPAPEKTGVLSPLANLESGKIPANWKVEATKSLGDLATWQAVSDSTAPGGMALAMTAANHDSGSTFNLCWTDSIQFKDGTLEVQVKANSGETDQGGGLIWRARDANNYYIARFNPLEDNFRLYSIKDGTRKQLATAKATVEKGAWFKLTIIQSGAHCECYLDGVKMLEADDTTFADAGGVGLWTKADAATSFAGLVITPK
ncbi:MAG: DUF1080 domain-containing protein [Planctomycetes bacterium]|nr:DUF1080 domain-containing protein [Planctomycetota bacterium]